MGRLAREFGGDGIVGFRQDERCARRFAVLDNLIFEKRSLSSSECHFHASGDESDEWHRSESIRVRSMRFGLLECRLKLALDGQTTLRPVQKIVFGFRTELSDHEEHERARKRYWQRLPFAMGSETHDAMRVGSSAIAGLATEDLVRCFRPFKTAPMNVYRTPHS